MKTQELAKYLDYTNLSNTLTRKQLNKMIEECVTYNFGGLCISPCWINYAKNRIDRLRIKNLNLLTVPNYFLGGGLNQLEGIAESCCATCDEIDYIWNVYEFGDLKDWEKTKKELEVMRKYTKGKLKVIIESHYLRIMDDKLHKVGIKKVIKEACNLVNESGADWIKTDSGLFKRDDFDTLYEDCKYMVKYSKNGIKVKAAGGIKTRQQAEQLIKLGVMRIGTSNAVEIVTSDL